MLSAHVLHPLYMEENMTKTDIYHVNFYVSSSLRIHFIIVLRVNFKHTEINRTFHTKEILLHEPKLG